MAESARPSFEHERIRMALIVDGIRDSIPAEVFLEARQSEGALRCGKGDGAQSLAYRYVDVSDAFDDHAWLDALVTSYENQDGWRIDRREAVADLKDHGATFWSPKGNSTRVDIVKGRVTATGFNSRDDAVGEPAKSITISSSSECADAPENYDNFGDFLEETPLPTPLPPLPAK